MNIHCPVHNLDWNKLTFLAKVNGFSFWTCFQYFFKNPFDNFKLIFSEDSTLDDTEGTEISELMGEEEGAEGSGDLPSSMNVPLTHTTSYLIPLQRIAMLEQHKKH